MFDLKWNILRTTVGTLTPPLFEQVLAHFITHQFALLILHARHFRVLKFLSIEFHEFHAQANERSEAVEFVKPCHDIIDATLDAGWQPPFWSSPVVETRRTITGLAVASRTSYLLSSE